MSKLFKYQTNHSGQPGEKGFVLAEDQRETVDCCIHLMLPEEKREIHVVRASWPASVNSESSWRRSQDKHLQKIKVTCLKENKIFSIGKVEIRMTSYKLFFRKLMILILDMQKEKERILSSGEVL